MPASKTAFKTYKMPADIAGHKYAGPVALRRTNGRPIPSWKDMPFEATTAPGTPNRSRERVQAHLDRIQLMKAHHVTTKKAMMPHKAAAKKAAQAVAKAQRNVRTSRAMLDKSKTEAARQKYRGQMNRAKVVLADRRANQTEANRMEKMHVTELRQLEKEIAKVTGRLAKNRTKVKAAAPKRRAAKKK